MANDFLSQILGHVLTGAGAQQQNSRLDTTGSMGDLLGGFMGSSADPAGGLSGFGGLGKWRVFSGETWRRQGRAHGDAASNGHAMGQTQRRGPQCAGSLP